MHGGIPHVFAYYEHYIVQRGVLKLSFIVITFDINLIMKFQIIYLKFFSVCVCVFQTSDWGVDYQSDIFNIHIFYKFYVSARNE
jgi:hypothetical protein